MDKEAINNRFLSAIDVLLAEKRGNKTTIATTLQIGPTKFTEILKRRMKAGIDTVAILCHYYKISPAWILLGEGTMFLADGAPTPDTLTQKDLSILIDKISRQAEEIGKLKEQLAAIKNKNRAEDI